MIAGEQHAYAGLGSVVARAYLIKLRDCAASFFPLSELQICFRQQIEFLWAVRMLLDLFQSVRFRRVECGPGERGWSGCRDIQTSAGRDGYPTEESLEAPWNKAKSLCAASF